MARLKQISFLKEKRFQKWNRTEHGGRTSAGRRKEFRPIDPRRALHLVLRSSRARGEWSFLRTRHERRIRDLVRLHARKNGIRIEQYANAGNHLHLLVRMESRAGFQRFLRTIAGLIPRLVTGARKGDAKGKFWDALAYTRVVEWGRAFLAAKYYVIQNEMEASGVWGRREKPG